MQIPFLHTHTTTEAPSTCCQATAHADIAGMPLVAIVGSPNVGKSVLFNHLTGIYVTVSNYPGTTVELSRGKGRLDGIEFGVVDTPGMYRLLPLTEEERVARQILLQEQPDLVIHVVDAKNLARMLPMTLQLIEAGFPVILDVNLMDEAERLGVKVDVDALAAALGIPVVATALARRQGVDRLKAEISRLLVHRQAARPAETAALHYPASLETGIQAIATRLNGHAPRGMNKRAVALLLLQQDAEVTAQVQSHLSEEERRALSEVIQTTQARFRQPLPYVIAQRHQEEARRILQTAITLPESRPNSLSERLSRAMINPVTGLPILLAVLYLLYEFVGVFGAQTLVDFLESVVFEGYVNPWVDALLAWLIPWTALRELFGGEYGIFTLGIRYAIAIILPVVGTFFIAFSIIEDSGYLPRLAMLIDRVFKKIGLNGRAVIPMVLGLGCDTMATIVTRTLETPRERVISTLLLALAIPCSAQLGVIMGLLAGQPAMLLVWAGVVTGVFLLIGYLSAQILPGERPAFYMELPPLRVPTPGNVLVKTYTRMEWYLREVIPLFILASIFIWIGRMTGLFDAAVEALVPVVHLLGLPDEAAVAFLFGFFRRDYGAAGLYDISGQMNAVQLAVSAVTLTLFVPCIAQFAVMLKERGWKTTLAINAFIIPFAFLVGWVLYQVLRLVV